MTTGFGILFAITSLFPGFFLFNFFKDAFGEYKRTGKYFWSTLLSSPGLFFVSLAAFVGMAATSVFCLLGGL